MSAAVGAFSQTCRPASGGEDRADGTPAGGGSLSVITDGRFVLFMAALFGFSLICVQYLATLPLAVRGNGMSNGVYARW